MRRSLTLAAVQSLVLTPVLGFLLVTPPASEPTAAVTPLPTTDPAVVVTRVPPPVVKPRPVRATTTARATPRPTLVATPTRQPAAPRKTVTRRVVTSTRTAPTGRALMLAAVARIPGYPSGGATWVMTSKYGSWGPADWRNGVVYISPSVPASRMYDVVAHEWAHLLSVRPYPSTTEAKAAMNRVFGGSGLTGAERAADCMARQLGATWTNYSPCTDATWKAAAAKLLAGQRV